MENSTSLNTDQQFEQLKADITREVREQLLTQNVTIIDDNYNAEQNVVDIINKYNTDKQAIEEAIKYNYDTYKTDKAEVENYCLRLDLQELKAETLEELDKVAEKQAFIFEEQVREAQNDPKYAQAKVEALNILALLKGCDIPTPQLMDIISPMINAYDTKALGICSTLLQDSFSAKYTIDSAISGIEDLRTNSNLNYAIDTMKQYVTTGEDGLGYYAVMSKHKHE